MGNFIEMVKISMGDFAVLEFQNMDSNESIIMNYTFFFCWFIVTIIMMLIFLNFIIAEASASYEKISAIINEMILLDRC